ncbi:MAG: helix-turn-helix domain-containing protein [Oscillospiraceae bacterium]|nr:helix-turn-helix domain-containing protein [Oscillospiraceae bacterium]
MKEESFGARLRAVRQAHGETQPELARLLGVTRSAVSMYETGEREPKYELLTAIAAHYGVELDYLLGRPAAERPEEDPDIRMIARAGQKMSPEQRQNLLRYARFMFPEAFDDREG